MPQPAAFWEPLSHFSQSHRRFPDDKIVPDVVRRLTPALPTATTAERAIDYPGPEATRTGGSNTNFPVQAHFPWVSPPN